MTDPTCTPAGVEGNPIEVPQNTDQVDSTGFDPAWTVLTFPFAPELAIGRIRLDTIFELARSRGLTGLDILAADVKLYCLERVKRRLDDHGLTVSSLIIVVNFLKGDAKLRAQLEKTVERARCRGATRIMIVPADALTARRKMQQLSVEDRLEMHVRGFKLAVTVAAATGMEILLEDTPTLATSLSSGVDCRALLDRVPSLGFVYDTANMYPPGEDPIDFFHAVKDRIRHVHLKDVEVVDHGPGDATLDGRHVQMRVLGEGQVPLTRIIRLLAEHGSIGELSIEYKRPSNGASLANHTTQFDSHVTAGRAMADAISSAARPLRDVRPFRWAYIGTGSIAASTSRKILKTGSHEIATVFSRTPGARQVRREGACARRNKPRRRDHRSPRWMASTSPRPLPAISNSRRPPSRTVSLITFSRAPCRAAHRQQNNRRYRTTLRIGVKKRRRRASRGRCAAPRGPSPFVR